MYLTLRRQSRCDSHASGAKVSSLPILGALQRPPNVALLRALWSLLDGIWGSLKGSWGVLVGNMLLQLSRSGCTDLPSGRAHPRICPASTA